MNIQSFLINFSQTTNKPCLIYTYVFEIDIICICLHKDKGFVHSRNICINIKNNIFFNSIISSSMLYNIFSIASVDNSRTVLVWHQFVYNNRTEKYKNINYNMNNNMNVIIVLTVSARLKMVILEITNWTPRAFLALHKCHLCDTNKCVGVVKGIFEKVHL